MRAYSLADFAGRYEVIGDCWIWTGAKSDDGYGRFYWQISGKKYRESAHRAMFKTHYGQIPIGKSVLHTCDTPACINPNHLYAGTQQENVRDRKERGRGGARLISGELHVNAKLTADKVLRIRAAARGAGKKLCRELGISRTQYSRIRRGESWKHI